jgi:dimeric dUTPase (all-alpha-NTP-PPase superfamily)
LNWKQLYNMQKELDRYIEKNNNLENKNVFQEKHLALLVELGELANETRCFKFWSQKPRNEKHIILEEYVDGIHFILSLGIENDYYYMSEKKTMPTFTETEQFIKVFQACTLFHSFPTEENYQAMFESYLQLGKLLGFTEEDIQRAYLQKNEVNFKRQDTGY